MAKFPESYVRQLDLSDLTLSRHAESRLRQAAIAGTYVSLKPDYTGKVTPRSFWDPKSTRFKNVRPFRGAMRTVIGELFELLACAPTRQESGRDPVMWAAEQLCDRLAVTEVIVIEYFDREKGEWVQKLGEVEPNAFQAALGYVETAWKYAAPKVRAEERAAYLARVTRREQKVADRAARLRKAAGLTHTVGDAMKV